MLACRHSHSRLSCRSLARSLDKMSDEFAFAVNSLVVILVAVENVSHAAAAMNFASVSEKSIPDEEDRMSRYNIASSCPVGSCHSAHKSQIAATSLRGVQILGGKLTPRHKGPKWARSTKGCLMQLREAGR